MKNDICYDDGRVVDVENCASAGALSTTAVENGSIRHTLDDERRNAVDVNGRLAVYAGAQRQEGGDI